MGPLQEAFYVERGSDHQVSPLRVRARAAVREHTDMQGDVRSQTALRRQHGDEDRSGRDRHQPAPRDTGGPEEERTDARVFPLRLGSATVASLFDHNLHVPESTEYRRGLERARQEVEGDA